MSEQQSRTPRPLTGIGAGIAIAALGLALVGVEPAAIGVLCGGVMVGIGVSTGY